MDEWTSRAEGIFDSHVHVMDLDSAPSMEAIREATGVEKMSQAAIQDPATGGGLPEALLMKHRHPETYYVFAGLNHAQRLTDGRVSTPSLAEQVGAFTEMGCDGIKMLEGKPDCRRELPVPVTDSYYADYWARVEEAGLPVLWHVNDPEEFWDPERIPVWAGERNWGYGPEDASKEDLYAEVDIVLSRHPHLKISFAHFYFLSADLPRAGRLLDEHPGVNLDLAPGIEMLYNISRDPEVGREFFIEYADRIIFGTDLFSSLTIPQARIRAGIVFRWLETDDTFRLPEEADSLLGPPEDGVVRGMALPEGALRRIYTGNFIRLAGLSPRPLNADAAAGTCRRLADIAHAMSGVAPEKTPAGRVADILEA